MRERIDELESGQSSLEQEYKQQRDEFKKMIADAQSDVDELRKVLKEARKLLQRNSADLGAELQEVRERVQQLRGELQEAEFKLKRLRDEFQVFRSNVETQLATELPDEPKKLFKRAKQEYDKGNFRAARNAFAKYLREHGDKDNADDAQYFIAQTHYQQENWRVAIQEFQKVMNNHPDSERTADSVHRIGVGFMSLGKCDAAKPFFETVLAEHGGADVADDARQKLQQFEAGNCPKN